MNSQLAEQTNVYGFLQQTIDQSNQQNKSLQLMLNRMIEIENNVNEKFEIVSEMVEEVRNDIKLKDHETHDLQQAVYNKSIVLAKDRFHEDSTEFSVIVGKYRRMIWSKLKRRFEVSKYIHIRRIDFLEAMEFVQKFSPEDYI